MDKDNFTIIVDTREQQPWVFKHHATANQKLDTGDYSIQGYEDIICIERKHSISEFVNNMTEKRFSNVLERMSSYKYAFIIMEFDFDSVVNFPLGSDIPKRIWKNLKINPAYIIKYISDIQVKYNIKVLFCGSSHNAAKMAVSLMRRVIENNNTDD
jgi:ERCC4-type nuclease